MARADSPEIEPTVREAIRDLTKRTTELEKMASAITGEMEGTQVEHKEEFHRILISDLITITWMGVATFAFIKLSKEIDSLRELVKAE